MSAGHHDVKNPSGPHQVIERQLVRSGSILLLGLEPVSEEEFFAENPDGFSAAWTVGHLACVADLFSSWFDGKTLFEPAFHAVFNETEVTGPGPWSKAASVGPGFHTKPLLLLRFRQAMVKALRALNDEFSAGQWDEPGPPGTPVPLLTGGAVWEHLAVHVYWHLGALAGSMPWFRDTYTLNILPHYFYIPDKKAT